VRVRVSRILVLSLAVAALGLQGANGCNPTQQIVQQRLQVAGWIEPHTPGSGLPEEHVVPADSKLRQLLGDTIDLNRIDYVRTALVAPGAPPDVVLILVPGFLGGAGTFDPIARDLVREFNGRLEVWAVDRRPQQLEDRRGALHARAAAEAAGADLVVVRAAVAEGVRFYFPTATIDLDPVDGANDGPFPLPDAKPGDGDSGFLRLRQDDVRGFQAHWGVDTLARDWRELVLAARALVGEEGLVLFGGHSMGTTWTGVFAAYDFDPGPGVEAGHELVDGLVLLEGGGTGPPSALAPDLATYQATIASLETPGGPEVFLSSLFGFVDATNIGAAGELNGVAGTFEPDGDSLLQTTPVFGGIPVSILLGAPMTNRSIVGFFLDDDFSTNAAFSASIGFSANGSNLFNPIPGLVPGSFYLAPDEGVTRTWINYDSPRFDPSDSDPLVCQPLGPLAPPPEPSTFGGTGCAIIDNGPKPAPGLTGQWGVEREVSDVAVLLRTLYETGNASEWYFTSGRVNLDLAFGRDSSALGAPELLNVTEHANVDVPVLGIGGSNGLATTEASFAGYMGSTASSDTQVAILEGYAHLDVLTAEDNEALPVIVDWINHVQQQKLLNP